MLLTPERKAELLRRTKEAAAAFLEDVPYIREFVAKDDPSNAEIRRLSAVLRRIIVERDLVAISAPRLGEVTLIGPDNKPAYRSERKLPFLFFMTGGGNVLGGWNGSIWANDISAPKGTDISHLLNRPEFKLKDELKPDQTVQLSLDTFRTQRVLCYRRQWVSRQAVIKYVANIASGVHSGTARTDDDKLLGYIRNSARLMKKPDGSLHLDMFPKGIDTDESTFQHTPDAIDPVFIELVAAAAFLIKSPFISALEANIQEELRPR